MKKIVSHFKKVDLILYKALNKIGGIDGLNTRVPKDYFLALTREIINQQLSSHIAEIIFQRFLHLFPNQKVTPESILKLKHEQLRAVGMSNAKARFIQGLSFKTINKELNFKTLNQLDNEQVIIELTKVKGIGRWTAEMFLMFCLGREDIFSYADFGLKKAIIKLYNLKDPTLKQLEEITFKWSPYRTYACRILWKSLDS